MHKRFNQHPHVLNLQKQYDVYDEKRPTSPIKQPQITQSKIVSSLQQAIIQAGLKDGMTISFHHHFRHGDYTIELVMRTIAQLGIKNLTITASSFTKSHDCLIAFIKNGVVTKLEGSGLRGTLGDAVSNGILNYPVILRSHGGRARAIIRGETKIDVAFLAAASSDEMGNANGVSGPTICGSLGYAQVDAKYANKVIVLTNHLVAFPNEPMSIKATNVDYIVIVDKIGDPDKISSGEIHQKFSPKELAIAKNIVKVITNTKYFQNGFSYQAGTGGASQASLQLLQEVMQTQKITASFFLGGIMKQQVQMLQAGYVHKLLDTQSFDATAAQSIGKNQNHVEISASMYASIAEKMCCVNKLDYGVLSALEVDLDFNINVITGADGHIRGAIGGHQDVAQGAKITIVAIPLFRGRIPSINKKIQTIVTPGTMVDVVVCEYGVAVNPLRTDLIEELSAHNVRLANLTDWYHQAIMFTGNPEAIAYDYNHVIAVVEYLDGRIIDLIYKPQPLVIKP